MERDSENAACNVSLSVRKEEGGRWWGRDRQVCVRCPFCKSPRAYLCDVEEEDGVWFAVRCSKKSCHAIGPFFKSERLAFRRWNSWAKNWKDLK